MLAEALKGDKPQMDQGAAEAISAVNDPSVIDAALDAIRNGRNVLLATQALKKAEDPRVVPAMIGILASKDMEAYYNAVKYLGTSKASAAVDALVAALVAAMDAHSRKPQSSGIYVGGKRRRASRCPAIKSAAGKQWRFAPDRTIYSGEHESWARNRMRPR